MDFVRIAVVGCGGRGQYLLEGCVFQHEKARVVAVCDIYEDRCDNAEKLLKLGMSRTEAAHRCGFFDVSHMDKSLVKYFSGSE